MKKIVYTFLIIILIISVFSSVKAYSTNDYSIEIPATYNELVKGSFTKANGANVNIQVVPFSGSSTNSFSEKELDRFVNNINSEIENLREELKKNINEQYGQYLSEEEIDEYIKSFKCNSIDTKEITTATRNNYKCYHIIANYSAGEYNYYADQYSFVSNNKIYTLTASAESKSELESSEIRDIINSFTIADYKDPEKVSFFSNELLTNIIIPVIVALIGGGIGLAVNKNKTKQESNASKEDVEKDKEE